MTYTLTSQLIKLQIITGEFINRGTGDVWKVYIKDQCLMIEVPHFNFLLTPLSATRFKPVNSQVKIEIEFETTDENRFMHVYVKGSEKAVFELLN